MDPLAFLWNTFPFTSRYCLSCTDAEVPVFLIYQLTALNIAPFQSLFKLSAKHVLPWCHKCSVVDFHSSRNPCSLKPETKGTKYESTRAGLKGSSADRGLTLNYKMKVTNRKVWSFQSIESLFLNLRWSFFFGILNRRPPKLKRPPSAFFAGYFPVFMPPLTYVKTSDPRDYILKILEFSILPSTSSKRRLSLTW